MAEHLSPNAADAIVASLCSASDVILFGAAIPGQGGVNHTNEQPQSFWAKKFRENGYAPYDLFRPSLWDDSDIEIWYRQNTFLYVKGECPSLDHCKITSLAFMDIRHPDLQVGIKARVSDLSVAVTGVGTAVKRRLLTSLPARK